MICVNCQDSLTLKICVMDFSPTRKFPELFKWFKDFLGYKESGMIEAVPSSAIGKERICGELAMEIGMIFEMSWRTGALMSNCLMRFYSRLKHRNFSVRLKPLLHKMP